MIACSSKRSCTSLAQGPPWRDLPAEFGQWDAVYNRFRRWEARGIWRQLWERLQEEKYQDALYLFIEATIVRAHQHAAGALKKTGGQAAQALGRSRGGFSTTIHAGCRDERHGVARVVTEGQCHESPLFDTVLAQVPSEHTLTHAIMDKAYDSDQSRTTLIEQDVIPVIPPTSNRTAVIDYDRALSKLREKVARFFNNLKQFRRMATRYEKLSQTFLAFLHVVAAWISIR